MKTLARKLNQKLSARFYGPYEVLLEFFLERKPSSEKDSSKFKKVHHGFSLLKKHNIHLIGFCVAAVIIK